MPFTHDPILVTGAAGFVGARFVQASVRSGRSVISVDAISHFAERTENSLVPFGKCIDRDQLFEWLTTENPRLSGIVHLGACTDTTLLDMDYFHKMNLAFSQRLWSYAVVHKIPFIYASSAATYGDGANGYTDDETQIHLLRPLNPYGQSKQNFDVWVLEQERLGLTPPIWTGFKFFNVYGFGERHKGKMCSFVLQAFDQIRNHKTVHLFKSDRAEFDHGFQKRDFIYVEDVVDVLEFALSRPIQRGIFNLGTGTARTFLSLTQAVFSQLRLNESIQFIEMPEALRARYQYFTQANMDRLRQQGYRRAFLNLEEGISLYVRDLLRVYC